ncbi:swarming inhibition tyrosine decarboxylase DisA [Proteus mirabilis]|uniref:swarming inhibition tyrosine decarboxylase DisA n=1 Tax=Proteus mirabilis TaxID=584 RepID=UPI000F5CE5B6|nr:swarming inhibition tyrosine decarboxylase DisA [Proteus mirabilis]AZG98487.1 tyrosine decarboxylase [Proteus mirabilis]MBG2992846.1 tyrosine decarboxylase [Proteus mirabilis]MCI9766313.1 tyrosine decarboxylase [Proteus mirabilis]MCI9769900.1 tyrosine decarboxylase [Proteus mirabilis]MCI9773494.1 tyrosine decarboxylase [Proteus mirabilis]
MANHKETCLSAAERVFDTRTVDTLTCYHREMIKMLMDSGSFYSSPNNSQINANEILENKIKSNIIENKAVKGSYDCILNNLNQQLMNNKPEIEPYFSHYHSPVMQLAKLGYLSALAYNADNVFNKHSPIQKQQEQKITHDLCKLIGFEPDKAFGHITTSHVFACYEILWALRNLKTLPMAIARHPKSRDLVADKKAFELFNMSITDILSISEQLYERDIFDDVSHLTCRGTGMTRTMHLGKLLVPIYRFEFWKKAMDILGLGYDNLIALPIDEEFKTDIAKTRHIVLRLIEQGEPILGIIGVLGSSTYGSIDKLKPLFELREECEKQHNNSFYIHIDASQLGYMKSLFLDENNSIIPYNILCDKLKQEAPILELTSDIYDSFTQLSRADSVSFEPFQAGFSPYPTGIVCIKDARLSRFLANPPKLCPEEGNIPDEIDGIQSAPAVASMWGIHQLYAFNNFGYGQCAQNQWEARVKLEQQLKQENEFEKSGISYAIHILPVSDFNKLTFAIAIKGNPYLKIQNQLNNAIYKNLEIKSQYKQDLNLLVLCARNSDDIPAQFCQQCQLGKDEWKQVNHLNLLQLTIKNTEKWSEGHIKAGCDYIKKVVLSALK